MTKKGKTIDYYLFFAAAVILILGILIVSDVSTEFSLKIFKTSNYFFLHQLFYAIVPGIILAFILFKMPLDLIKKWAGAFMLFSLFFMALVFVPGIGISLGGASRWLDLRFFSFQPSELLKLSFIIYISAWLAKKNVRTGGRKQRQEIFVPFLLIIFLIGIFFYFQSDASTLALIFAVSAIIYFLAKTHFLHNFLISVLGLLALLFLIIVEPYRLNRISVYLGILKDPMGLGYQFKQALITIGSGGFWGKGLGMSFQKVSFDLPQIISDSIFAVFAEELGFLGSSILIFLFLFFLWRVFLIAKKSRDEFSRLFAFGFGSWIFLQAFINIGAIIGIIPLTGIPLPFISYGGSHIVVELAGLGIILNISKNIPKNT